ncbi:hypothetical protein GTY67_19135 [Streptomyces sp. SID8374]|uniref:hypothetical protein n=1 Tax=Streptomyces sp. SID8374 TaxID=2690354 RepID=UPI00136EE358|nr:hypothetical protein [Streptomyces sp. SID8374]MYX15476.1 hypothetical protein [Streptomyces sp. SID8374]
MIGFAGSAQHMDMKYAGGKMRHKLAGTLGILALAAILITGGAAHAGLSEGQHGERTVLGDINGPREAGN